ncbi:MAG: hypothetical protein IPH93_10215 [Saprospiraceae bacterium]|nr:hypothetical protein [Saprospiraceae bacterium]MBK7812422.1 hypothetical protein [Saprospiraceae bacterium]MBK9632353.1 hypothetical protein [Saprospiraceae bacterium]
MRLIGQIPHPKLLISVFKSNQKIIFKFEIGPFEQTYKFLETEQLNDLASATVLVTEEWITNVFATFDEMNQHYKKISALLQ